MLVHLHLVGLTRLTEGGLLDAGVGHLHVVHGLPVEHAHGAVGQLALLSADVSVELRAVVAAGKLDVAVVAVVAVAVSLSVLVYHLDVEHAAGALCVVFGSRRGDDVDALHHRGRHRLGNLREVVLEHLVGLAVDIDLEAGRAFDGDVVLSVDVDHGHLSEHVEERHGLGVGILLHVVGHLVGGHPDDGLLRHDLDALEVEAVVDGRLAEAVGGGRSLG